MDSTKHLRLICFVIIASPALLISNTIHVPGDFATIQEAIDTAMNGDMVLVAAGTYVENINFTGKAIAVKSIDGPLSTFINGGNPSNPDHGSVVTFDTSEGPDSVLEGFTLTCGTGFLFEYYSGKNEKRGGGIFCLTASPTLTDIHFIENSSRNGGGLCNESGSNPALTSCLFAGNRAEHSGGGIYNNDESSPTLNLCTFLQNIAEKGSGGGMIIVDRSEPLIMDCIFSMNAAGWSGGGMQIGVLCDAVLIDCVFDSNSAADLGGGIYCFCAGPELRNCTFSHNLAFTGGGMRNYGSIPVLTNCVFLANSSDELGGAICNHDSSPVLTHCTFHGNSNGGIYNTVASSPVLIHCIVWDNPPAEIHNSSASSNPIVSYSCVQGGYSGTGNINADPLFADPGEGDLHLLYTSPCRDSGNNGTVTELHDFEGDPRIAHGTVDMGADELFNHLYVKGNEIPGGDIVGRITGLPSTAPVGLFVGSGALPSSIPTMWGEFWLQAPWILFTLYPIPANGLLEIPTTLPGSIPAPYDVPMQALIGLDPDSLTNLCVLEVR